MAAILGAWARARRKTSASGRLPARATSSAEKSIDVQPRRPCSRKEDKFMYRPVQPRKIYLPPRATAEEKENYRSRPAVGKNIYRPVPPGKKIFTVPSRRGKNYVPPCSVGKICPVKFYRPVPSRNFARAVPSRQLFYIFILPSRCPFFSHQIS